MHADLDFDAGAFEHAEACAAHALVRVCHRDDDSPHAGVNRELGARGAAVFVRAGLEVDVHRAVPRSFTGSGERHLFGVWLPSLQVISLARHVAISVKDDCSHHRIGARSVVGLACELDGARRPVKVYVSVTFWRMQSSKYIREPNQTAERSTTEKGL
jgi:hypothetical protein